MKIKRGYILITGASTGIGAMCAEFMNEAGFRVFSGVRKKEDAERIALNSRNKIIPVLLDVTNMNSIDKARRFIELISGEEGLSGLINNAGTGIAGPLEFLPMDVLRNQIEVNVVGQVAVTQAMLPMLRKGKGRVINIGSISGKMATPFLGPYAASKHALEALTDSLRMELQPWNIPVSILQVGSIITPIWSKSLKQAEDLLKTMPENGKLLYGKTLAKVAILAGRRSASGTSPSVLAKTIFHALTARRPRIRYKVGKGAKFRLALVQFLPSRILDWLIIKSISAIH